MVPFGLRTCRSFAEAFVSGSSKPGRCCT
ncbi:(Fe-S)-binding protein [Actinoplanes sp. NPDC023801]